MKEEQFDHIENKIREAAAASEPDFDEQSWQKMELLLDKDKDRKRRPFWLLLTVLLCALATGYFIFNKNEPQKTSATTPLKKKTEINSSNKPTVTIATSNTGSLLNLPAGLIKKSTNGFAGKTMFPIAASQSFDGNKNDEIRSERKNNISTKSKTRMLVSAALASDDNDNEIIAIDNGQKKDVVVNDKIIDTSSTANLKEVLKEVKKDSTEEKKILPVVTSSEKNKNKKNINNRFYLLALAGVEASSVKLFSLHNSTLVGKYSVGVGYSFNNKWSIQTGFSVSRKKYIAGAGDYNPKAGSYWSMVEIKKVDANCLIYEIPLIVRYNFLQKNKSIFFATAGISSLIMKKEDYNYTYVKDNYTYEGNWIYTGNKNIFSTLTVSAGIEKPVGPRISLLAEAFAALPLAGIGDGKVKLFSFGLQAGIKYNFLKKK